MDALIRTAWKAFWVGLGASAVLIGQSLLAPPSVAASSPSEVAAPVPPMLVKVDDPVFLRAQLPRPRRLPGQS
jgi:hypothetical protein